MDDRFAAASTSAAGTGAAPSVRTAPPSTPCGEWNSTTVCTRPHGHTRTSPLPAGARRPCSRSARREGPLVRPGRRDPHRARVGLGVVAQDDRDRLVALSRDVRVRDDVGSRVLFDYRHRTAPLTLRNLCGNCVSIPLQCRIFPGSRRLRRCCTSRPRGVSPRYSISVTLLQLVRNKPLSSNGACA